MHNFVYQLVEAGHFLEARAELERLDPHYAEVGGPLLRLRRQWIAGRIHRGLGSPGRAEQALIGARREFIQRGLGLDAAAVGLDLALLYVEEGRAEEVRRLAEDTVPIFLAQDIHREAAAALLLFQEAARHEAVTRSMLMELTAYLRRIRPQSGDQVV
jgi:hypothetical protein